MENRPTWDEYFMQITKVVATRGSCVRRKVGAVIVDSRNVFLESGYNGKAAGIINCLDSPCEGAYAPSGTSLEKCEAIHAEAQCLIRCSDVMRIHTLYVSCSPCISCVKMLMQTSCMRIVFAEDYPHSDSKKLWLQSKEGRTWEKVPFA